MSYLEFVDGISRIADKAIKYNIVDYRLVIFLYFFL